MIAYNTLGEARLHMGRFREADYAFRKVLELSSYLESPFESAWSHFYRSLIAVSEQRTEDAYGEAKAGLNDAIHSESRNLPALICTLIAHICMVMGAKDEAREPIDSGQGYRGEGPTKDQVRPMGAIFGDLW